MNLETPIRVRTATADDAPAIARLRTPPDVDAAVHEREADRVRRYLAGEHHPQHARAPRAAFVAVHGADVVGVSAGHLTDRLGCDGELQWLSVAPDYRGRGLGAGLLRPVAAWFGKQRARRVCVDPDEEARGFYAKLGAVPLDEHFMVWDDVSVLHDA